jgi:hypothetical protein
MIKELAIGAIGGVVVVAFIIIRDGVANYIRRRSERNSELKDRK